MHFGYEDLDVWNRTTDFAVKVVDLIETTDTGRKHFRLAILSAFTFCLLPFPLRFAP